MQDIGIKFDLPSPVASMSDGGPYVCGTVELASGRLNMLLNWLTISAAGQTTRFPGPREHTITYLQNIHVKIAVTVRICFPQMKGMLLLTVIKTR